VQSPHWDRHEVAIDVPDNAHAIIVLLGNGAAAFGDLAVEWD
jgi:hypothetical protein